MRKPLESMRKMANRVNGCNKKGFDRNTPGLGSTGMRPGGVAIAGYGLGFFAFFHSTEVPVRSKRQQTFPNGRFIKGCAGWIVRINLNSI